MANINFEREFKMFKFKKPACILVLTAAIVMLAFGPVAAADTNNPILAKVNGVAVYKAELDKRMNLLVRQISMQPNQLSEADIAELRQRVLNDLIEYKMLLQEAEKQGLKVDAAEVDAEFAALKSGFNSDADFAKALADSGVAEADFRQTVTDSILIQKLFDKQLASKIAVSEKEALEFYQNNPSLFEQEERVHARHILKMVAPNANAIERDKQKKELEEVLRAIKNGADFAEMAMKYSDDSSKIMGGDLGYFTRGRMVKPFEDTAFTLEIGDVSGIVETQFGYHIIKVEDHQQPRTIPFEEIKGVLVENLSIQKQQEAIGKYVGELRKKAQIEITGLK